MRRTDWTEHDLTLYTQTPEVQLRRYYEPKPGLFIAESEKVIRRALAAGYEPLSFLAEEGRAEKSQSLFEPYDVPVYVAEEPFLRHLVGYELTGGLLCAMHRRPLPSPSGLLRGARRVAVLCDITNPTNVGAIFRSAAALGMDAVLLTEGCSDPLYRRSARVSMGTVFQIPWTWLEPEPTWNPHLPHRCPDGDSPCGKTAPSLNELKEGTPFGEMELPLDGSKNWSAVGETKLPLNGSKDQFPLGETRFPLNSSKNRFPCGEKGILLNDPKDQSGWISFLRSQGFLTVAMALEPDAISIRDIRLREADRIAIILGNEGNGLPGEVVQACDYTAMIPMAHEVDSLNVAAASAVVFWELGPKEL